AAGGACLPGVGGGLRYTHPPAGDASARARPAPGPGLPHAALLRLLRRGGLRPARAFASARLLADGGWTGADRRLAFLGGGLVDAGSARRAPRSRDAAGADGGRAIAGGLRHRRHGNGDDRPLATGLPLTHGMGARRTADGSGLPD